MRLLLQVDRLSDAGTRDAVIDLAQRLDSARFQPGLLVLGDPSPVVAHVGRCRVQVFTLPEVEREDAYRRLLCDEKIDLVDAHDSLFGAAIAASQGVPFVETVHNPRVWFTPQGRRAWRDAIPYVSGYLCVSADVAADCDRGLGLPASKTVLLPDAIGAAGIEIGRAGVHQAYLEVMSWVARGGRPEAARCWTSIENVQPSGESCPPSRAA